MRIIWTIHLLLFPLFFCCAPDAERSNPFDPQSSHYKGTGGLFGRVTSYYDRPIDAAQIQILPGLKGVLSDGRGDYAISDIPGGEYLVTASKEGYAPDTSEVT
ncbi:MAG: carboxypeptidase-like regulatory domain-containing protein, partial [bacterium]